MKDLIKTFDNLPWALKIILCLPVLDIAWAIYRIVKGAESKNVTMIVAGVLWIVFGCIITWLVDLVCTVAYKKPTILA